jgi:hypothetical protein
MFTYICIPPLCQVLLLPRFKNNLTANSALGRISVALHRMRHCLVFRNHLLTVGTLDVIVHFVILIIEHLLLLLGEELFLTAKHFLFGGLPAFR